MDLSMPFQIPTNILSPLPLMDTSTEYYFQIAYAINSSLTIQFRDVFTVGTGDGDKNDLTDDKCAYCSLF